MASYTDYLTTPAVSTTGTLKRTVADTIRHLYSGTPFLNLVSSGKVPKDNQIVRQRNLIGKRRVATPKYEAFTFTPFAAEYTSTSTGTTSVNVSDATGLRIKYTVVNTTNFTVARISAISSNTLTLQSIGDTSFSCTSGNKLLVMGSAYEENSTSPQMLMKDPDNMYNFTQISRAAVGISETAEGNPHFGGHRYKLTKEENLMLTLQRAEYAMLFSERASGSNETTTDATLGDSFRTMRGLWNWAQTSYDAGGNLTHDAFISSLPLSMHESTGSHMKKIMLCGTKVWGDILGWIQAALVVQQNNSGSYKKFGVESKVIATAKGDVEVVLEDAFNRGDLSECALIFCPDKVDYVHLRDRDYKPNKSNLAANDRDGRMDEIKGEVSVCPWDAGYSISKITNCN